MTDSTTPKRIQRKRTKGWRTPPNTVYVGRGSPWGNPFAVTGKHSTAGAVEKFREYLEGQLRKSPQVRASLNYLRGKNLSCWCPLDQVCHADVLLELANETKPPQAKQNRP